MLLGVKLGPCQWRRRGTVINKRRKKEGRRTRLGGQCGSQEGGEQQAAST